MRNRRRTCFLRFRKMDHWNSNMPLMAGLLNTLGCALNKSSAQHLARWNSFVVRMACTVMVLSFGALAALLLVFKLILLVSYALFSSSSPSSRLCSIYCFYFSCKSSRSATKNNSFGCKPFRASFYGYTHTHARTNAASEISSMNALAHSDYNRVSFAMHWICISFLLL